MTPASPHSLHALRDAAGQETAAQLRPWIDSGLLTSAEVALAARLAALDGAPDYALVLAFALALRADRLGSALVDLAAVDVERLLADRERADEVTHTPALPEPWAQWSAALAARPALVSCPADDPTASADRAPFVLDGSRLYTARAWAAEARVAEGVHRLVDGHRPEGSERSVREAPAEEAQGRRTERSEEWTNLESSVLGLIEGDGAERQREAAASGVSPSRLQLVTGGPGTGKTYTVRAMLTLAWLRRAFATASVPRLEVRLAAPTGKAAQRMKEAMAAGLPSWCSRVSRAAHGSALGEAFRDAEALETALHAFLSGLAASTLHRLLGYQHFNPTRFRHDADNPLPTDLVVVDEASMVDLTMMAHLFDAIGDETRLVLVGDRRQLASVDTGTVLADLCTWGSVDEHPLVELNVSRRFPADSAVGRFAAASERLDRLDTEGETSAALQEEAKATVDLLVRAAETPPKAGEQVTVRWPGRESSPPMNRAPVPAEISPTLADELEKVATHWVGIMRALDRCPYVLEENGTLTAVDTAAHENVARLAGWTDGSPPPAPWEALGRLAEQVRVLAAHREGAYGVAGLNRDIWKRIESHMRKLPDHQRPSGILGRSTGDPTIGKPIIITRNDYTLGRFNGDVGLWVRLRRASSHEAEPSLMAVFPREGGGVSAHTSARLPAHEVVWAMTVHKSQGSEFDKVVFVLPERSTSLWTRELVYTGITRTRQELVLVGSPDVLVQGVTQRIRRASGLPKRLTRTGNAHTRSRNR